ncbi:echinoderm microtubule-associated protein-like 3 isoform X1 [Dunckerocampus dactyliophorus]|uniref:echinoderm microtubule-associated protein-like 3 isoform X1 n=1 Tax=Dunckerocampus dactyliophorus TaxID=161453 RepID=UPI0024070CCE|nr:echinoderm microtubule-associated protein-like 3 isoform X1 [Dunckerocampus dactyliophorus]
MESSTNSLDDVSADGSGEFTDRACVMETRLQAHEDEITLLKSSLADALRRIHLHEQLLPVLKQQLIAVNPAAARIINQVSCHDTCSSIYGVRQPHASQSAQIVVSSTNGHTVPAEPRPATVDRSSQTEAIKTGLDGGQGRVSLSGRVQSLHLEDALLPHVSVAEGTRAKLNRVPGMEVDEEDMEDDEEEGGVGEQDKELSWISTVEEPIQATTIISLQDGRRSPEDADFLPASSRPSDQNSGPSSSPLSPIQEGRKQPLVRTNSEKLANRKRQVRHLDKKAASSANLLNRSPSLENRARELIASAGSRRGTYSQEQSIKMFIRGRPITMYIPSNIQNYEELKMEPPSERLELDWVYGYRGRDCRANLYFLPTGEAVYFTACVIVLYHINKRTQRHYRKHTDCVRCLTLHPDKVRIASGQTAGVDKDGKPLQPCIHIWDSATLVTLQQIGLGTFQRGVGSVAFSTMDSGVFLCVIDDSNEHMLSVWDCTKGTKQAEIKTTNEAVFAVEFHPGDSSNIITCGKSHVYFWNLNAGQFTKKQGIFGKYKKPKFIQCFVFSLTGEVLTGDSEGNILTWGKSAADIKTLGKGAKETLQIMRQTRAHEGSVFTLCNLQGGGLLSGGSRDRKIIRWSADLAPERECEIPEKFGAVRTIADMDGEEVLVGTTRNAILRGTFSDGFVAIVQGHVDEMWGLATHPSINVFLSCGHDRQVCVWNTEEHKLDWSITLEEYGLCADFCPNGSVVSVGLNTGRWVALDLLTTEVISESVDGNEQLSVMRYSPDGSCLAVGSHDNFIYIYNVTESGRRYTRFGRCNGHSSFITHLDWSKDGRYIMSNSGDYEILYWDIAAGCKLLRNRFESKDREWASYTCVLGFHVMGEGSNRRNGIAVNVWKVTAGCSAAGVWLEGSDGTDINALCRSHSERVVAVADDFCKVHLFQYPCPKPKAPSHRYEGHGSHVTNVRFTHSDSHLLSMGGKDTCILQWRVIRPTSTSSTAASSPEPASSS